MEALLAGVRLHRETVPVARLRSLTATYNCVGMVFASRRTWVEPEEIRKILADDGYRQIADTSACVGDVVLYTDDQGNLVHVGLVASVDIVGSVRTINVMSKWGRDGEYIHPVQAVPHLCGRPSEFWTDRKVHHG